MGSLTRKIARRNLPKQRRSGDFYEAAPVFMRGESIKLPIRPEPEPYVSKYAHRDGESPLDAYARGVGYSGPEMPDKGLKDGSCNVTACQLPLLGMPQWTMKSHGFGGTDGKLYYCESCAMKFHEADRQFRDPLRCTLET